MLERQKLKGEQCKLFLRVKPQEDKVSTLSPHLNTLWTSYKSLSVIESGSQPPKTQLLRGNN